MKRPLAVLLFLLAAPVGAEEWPCWRGPRLDGTSAEQHVPLTWSAKENIAWKAALPGVGHSSPVVFGDRVYLTSADGPKRLLLCLDRRDGQVLWQRTVVESGQEPKHKLNSFSSSTPATDGRHVWVSFLRLRPRTAADVTVKVSERSPLPADVVPEMVVACYGADGGKLWEVVPGQFYSRHGFCSSVLPYKDLVIVNGDQDAEAFLVALDGATGKERWRVDRPNRTRSYCTPLIVTAGGRTQMVLSGSRCVAGYDPDTGKQLWQLDGPTEQFVASPVFGDGLLFITAGFPEYHNLALRPDGTGNVTKSHVAWHEKKTLSKKAAYVPSPAAAAGCFFVISDLGYLSCFEATTGKRLFMEKLGPHHSASPVVAESRLYLTDDDGTTHVVRAAGHFEVLANNPLGEACSASPAVAHGQIFIRTLHHLWCVGAPAAR